MWTIEHPAGWLKKSECASKKKRTFVDSRRKSLSSSARNGWLTPVKTKMQLVRSGGGLAVAPEKFVGEQAVGARSTSGSIIFQDRFAKARRLAQAH